MAIMDTVPNSQTTIRSALLTSLQPLAQNKIFLNPVIEDFPELKEKYLNVIKEPMSVSVIKYRLNAKTCKYSVLFEPLHDLTLLVYNCRKFSPDNQYLMDECTRFEQLILQCLNTFLFKINCQSLSTYAELTDLCLHRTL